MVEAQQAADALRHSIGPGRFEVGRWQDELATQALMRHSHVSSSLLKKSLSRSRWPPFPGIAGKHALPQKDLIRIARTDTAHP